MTILEARDLVFGYPHGGARALDGLNLAVARGETLAILGPNGAGKTTLLLHLNGSLRPQRGSVLLDGAQASYAQGALNAWRARVGLVLQDADDQLFAGTVSEDVSFGPLNMGLPEEAVRARVAAALEDVRIPHLADRPIHMLSVGQKRRTAIAGVLAMHPAVLLLDEPTAGLDPQGVVHLLAVLRRLSSAGTTIVYTTHDVDLAFSWADRVALFADGRVIACDAPDVAMAEPSHLRQAHLRPPLLLELGLRARALGLLPAEERMPRTAPAMLEMLERWAVALRAAAQPGVSERRHS